MGLTIIKTKGLRSSIRSEVCEEFGLSNSGEKIRK